MPEFGDFPPAFWTAILKAIKSAAVPSIAPRMLHGDAGAIFVEIGLVPPGQDNRKLRVSLYVCWTGGKITLTDAVTADDLGGFSRPADLTRAVRTALLRQKRRGFFTARTTDRSGFGDIKLPTMH